MKGVERSVVCTGAVIRQFLPNSPYKSPSMDSFYETQSEIWAGLVKKYFKYIPSGKTLHEPKIRQSLF